MNTCYRLIICVRVRLRRTRGHRCHNFNVLVVEGSFRFETFCKEIYSIAVFGSIHRCIFRTRTQNTKVSYSCSEYNVNPLACIFVDGCIIYNGRSSVYFTARGRPYGINPLNTIRVLIVSTRDINVHFNRYGRANRHIGRKTYECLIVAVCICFLLRTCRRCLTNVVFIRRNNYVLIAEAICRRKVRCHHKYARTRLGNVHRRIACISSQQIEISYEGIELKAHPFAYACVHRIVGNNFRFLINCVITISRINPRNVGIAIKRTRYHYVHRNLNEGANRQVGGKTYCRLIILVRVRLLRTRRHCFRSRNLNVSIVEGCSGLEVSGIEVYSVAVAHFNVSPARTSFQYRIISYRCNEANRYPVAFVCAQGIEGNGFNRVLYLTAVRRPYAINPSNGRSCPFVVIFIRCAYVL